MSGAQDLHLLPLIRGELTIDGRIAPWSPAGSPSSEGPLGSSIVVLETVYFSAAKTQKSLEQPPLANTCRLCPASVDWARR